MYTKEIEWDENNVLHFRLRHGIEPSEAEEVLAARPLVRKTKKGHYSAFGKTLDGRYLVVVFELKPKGIARPITGWDMNDAQKRCYRKYIGG